jgi:hypothetical protein
MLINDSQLIVVAKVLNDQQVFNQDPGSDLECVRSKLLINEVIKGDKSLEGKEINLVQSKVDADPIVKKGSQKLLFLKEAINPTMENEYYIRGLYQGQYNIKNNKIESVKKDNKLLDDDINSIGNINNLKAKIKEIK